MPKPNMQLCSSTSLKNLAVKVSITMRNVMLDGKKPHVKIPPHSWGEIPIVD